MKKFVKSPPLNISKRKKIEQHTKVNTKSNLYNIIFKAKNKSKTHLFDKTFANF